MRLLASAEELTTRLHEHHRHDPKDLAWHLNRAPELGDVLDRAALTDIEVESSGRTAGDIAGEIFSAIDW